jgi:hypothetical protein
MQNTRPGAARPLLRAVLTGLVGLGAAMGLSDPAVAQEIQPYEFTPLPAGTNLAIGYYVYGHNTEYNVANGPTIRNAKLEVNLFNARYVHFFDPVAGMPVGIQVFQVFGSESGANIGGQRVGSAFGAQNLALSAFVFPYVNPATKTNTNITAFLYPPTGTYDRNSAINVGDNRWRGDIQLGLTQGFGERIGVDLEFDAQFYGDNNQSFPRGTRLTEDPTYRVQVWGNYRWSPAFTTSIGYEGFFGGDQRVNTRLDGNKTDEHRIRANAALFVTPKLQTMLELNHDLSVTGGFKQDFGAQVRVLYAF